MELPLPSRVKPWILSANEAEMVTVRVAVEALSAEALGRPTLFLLPFGRPAFFVTFLLPFGRPGFLALFLLPFGRPGFFFLGCAIIFPFN